LPICIASFAANGDAVEVSEVPRWSFEVDERSVGVYVVIGTKNGTVRFQKSGSDPDALIREARAYTLGLNAEDVSEHRA
jgi:hypothetical protein